MTNNTADFTASLQSMETELQRLIQCQDYADIIASKLYIPEFSLMDALHAVQEAIREYEAIKTILSQYPHDKPADAAAKHLTGLDSKNFLQLIAINND
ncbi:hypothetical protein [Cylindrospermum stagnale]|uniref:hypothetical protein n=1 Tax=Cylindrospermum stagnale TaxID=142864 RepID=UPI0002F3148E|nr:hypothetical protein [Cylindrospermum stagnale]